LAQPLRGRLQSAVEGTRFHSGAVPGGEHGTGRHHRRRRTEPTRARSTIGRGSGLIVVVLLLLVVVGLVVGGIDVDVGGGDGRSGSLTAEGISDSHGKPPQPPRLLPSLNGSSAADGRLQSAVEGTRFHSDGRLRTDR
jgi:hypothetical protein